MMVRAPRAGTVIYIPDWNDEKKKVGDSVWRLQKVLEIVSLDKMMANGDVDEVDAARVAVGQKITLRLDAHPDSEFRGEIQSIVKTVQRQSYRNPLKVVRVAITLAEVDPERMRPGMRFRGTIETGRVADVLTIPTEALFVGEEGPVAYRRTDDGFETVRVTIGRRGKDQVEILSGLAPGDRVSRSDLGGGAW
jgi:multidrug efflux pump subunit AcrA (membrane-fusion protein)